MAVSTNGVNGTNGTSSPRSYLIWGGNGWIAQHLLMHLQSRGEQVESTTVRMENREAVAAELDRVKPSHVLNCAGCTGRPNVDWCEDNKEATVRSNAIGTLNLTDLCYQKGIHVTVFATGCGLIYPHKFPMLICSTGIYAYDDAHPIGGPGFKEDDTPNFGESFYSYTKSRVEDVRCSA